MRVIGIVAIDNSLQTIQLEQLARCYYPFRHAYSGPMVDASANLRRTDLINLTKPAIQMQKIPTSSHTAITIPPAGPRAALLPLLLDPDSDALVPNDRNKSIVNDIKLALSSDETPISVIDRIFQNATINNYAHILKVIVQGLSRHSTRLTFSHLEGLDLNNWLYGHDSGKSGESELEGTLMSEVLDETGSTSEPFDTTKGSTSPDKAPCLLKYPENLMDMHPERLHAYNPIFLQTLTKQEFAKKVTLVKSDPGEKESNRFSPKDNTVYISSGVPPAAMGAATHELSHARDHIALHHAHIIRAQTSLSQPGALSKHELTEAESLFSTELKAWLLEAMQNYLALKAGAELNRLQEHLIASFQRPYQDVLEGRYNAVQNRIVHYIGRLSQPEKLNIKSLFNNGDTPLKIALMKGLLLFRSYIQQVDSGAKIDGDLYLKRLDSIFHTDFYAESATEKGSKKETDLATLSSMIRPVRK